MTSTAYRLAVTVATASHAARAAAAMAGHFRGRDPAQAHELVARMQALRVLNARLGQVLATPAARRSLAGGATIPVVRSENGVFAGRGDVKGRRPALLRVARDAVAHRIGLVSGPQTVAKEAATVAKRVGTGALARARLAGASAMPLRSSLHGIHPTMGLPSRAASTFPGARRGLPAWQGPRLAARKSLQIDAERRQAASTGQAPRPYAVPAAQQTALPGFNRTVRAPESKAAAGNVYLDKALVGYHLAGAITAEQTRAAARPSISGASFNSSMAALRPTGAGS